jgi:sulfatase modifying factor 1
MKVFLSYASEDHAAAADVRLALQADGHDVFFDRDDLPAGEEFHARIRRGIEGSDLLVFLVSPRALDAGSYTLNELAIAEKAWASPAGRILPVLLERVDPRELPPLLRAVTFLETDGHVPAAVSDAVHRIRQARRRKRLWKVAIGMVPAVVVAVAAASYFAHRAPPATRVGQDGALAVLVRAGAFVMGDEEASPRREVYVDAFYMDRFETTTAQYAEFLASSGSVDPPEHWSDVAANARGELPVIGVDWYSADAYCRWSGKRLPTEAEWEKAARSDDERRYPWGDASPTAEHANYQNASPEPYDGGLSPVGTHPLGKSPFGVEDLSGNAAEWVADWHAESFRTGDVRNPRGPEEGSGKVVRGGGRFDPDYRIGATVRFFASPETRAEDIGFRCASDP